jgi:hypothetical protein
MVTWDDVTRTEVLRAMKEYDGTGPDFEGGKSGAVRVLGNLGFTVAEKQRPAR